MMTERLVRVYSVEKLDYEQRGIAASVSGTRSGDWERSILCWRSVRRRFRSPFLLFLVLRCTTTSPFVVGFARLPPVETRREHHSARAIAVDQVSGFA